MPGTIPSDSVNTDLIESTDFLPTIFEALNVYIPNDYIIDGKSFFPQLIGDKGIPREWMFFHFEPMNARHDITGWKAIRFVKDHDWSLYDTGELYDLNADLDEDIPIYPSEDTRQQATARKRLEPIFEQMVRD